MRQITIPNKVHDAEVLFVSHSGGKDSQATLAALLRSDLKDRIVLVHSDLGAMEWESMHTWIQSTAPELPLTVVKASMDFFEMVTKYKRFPSGHQQFCTMFLKTEPIEAFIHQYMTDHGLKTAINVTGMRADESKRRALKKPFALSEMTRPVKFPGHTIHDWLPIFDFSTLDVYGEIASAGQEPHWLYGEGFSRLSCVFCVNGRIGEHQKAAEMRPELALRMANLERSIGKTIRVKQINKIKYPKFLDEYITALPPMMPVGA